MGPHLPRIPGRERPLPEIASEVCHGCTQCFPLCPTSYLQAAFVLVEVLTARG